MTSATLSVDSKCLGPQPDVNKIPEVALPSRPDVIQDNNDIAVVSREPVDDENPSNVLMSLTSNDSIFNKKEVLAGQ